MHYWSDSNPNVLHESSLHYGLVRFMGRRDDQNRQLTVNGNRHRLMINEYFWPQLDDIDLKDMLFQRRHKPHSECHNQFIVNQVWITCYLTVQSVGRLGCAIWRIYEFTNIDFMNIDFTNIERKIATVPADLCLKIVKNWIQRLDFCKRAPVGHAKEIEFHS